MPQSRLGANAIIYYNSASLSRLLAKYEANLSPIIIFLIKKISPIARGLAHIHMGAHYIRSTARVRLSIST